MVLVYDKTELCNYMISRQSEKVILSEEVTYFSLRDRAESDVQAGPNSKHRTFCPYLCQLSTDFHNSYTGTFCGKLVLT